MAPPVLPFNRVPNKVEEGGAVAETSSAAVQCGEIWSLPQRHAPAMKADGRFLCVWVWCGVCIIINATLLSPVGMNHSIPSCTLITVFHKPEFCASKLRSFEKIKQGKRPKTEGFLPLARSHQFWIVKYCCKKEKNVFHLNRFNWEFAPVSYRFYCCDL